MTSYSHLLDYLGDLRASDRLDTPPGGTAGCELSDIYLCIIAQKAKTEADPLEYLRRIALKLHNKMAHGSWQNAAFIRIASWTTEFQRIAA
ncbi:hypothetical protein ACTJJ7_15940 [Phyllobacterium sp. 22229]|uniref:hypothetical protein n=1 Tax=Phyllobacterium sp. 22229 TaxID=3453895 RepID=UPI003F8520AC